MEPAISEQNICPHLGLINDPATLHIFPAVAHRCYAASPPAEIAAGHQSAYCLGHTHPNCLVFRGEEVRSGRPIGATDIRKQWLRYPLILVTGMGVLLLLSGVLWLILVPDASTSLSSSSSLAPVISPTLAPPSATLFAPTEDPILIPAAATLTPTFTQVPQPTAGPVTGTPVGPFSALVHVMRRGELLGDLAFTYQTRIEVLLAANNLTINDIIQEGQLVVIPVGVTDPTGVPYFNIYTVPEDQTLTDIGTLFGASPDEIRRVNDLGSGEVVPAGRTLLVPVVPTSTLTPSTP